MDPDNTRTVTVNGVEWEIRRDAGVRYSASDKGYYSPAGRSGYHFSTAQGERRFLQMGTMQLHDQDAFRALTESDLEALLNRAQPE